MNEKADEVELKGTPTGKAANLLDLALDINACIFLTSFVVYLILLVMEKTREGSVSSFGNVNTVLYVCLATGFIYILAGRSGPAARRNGTVDRSWRRPLPLPAVTAVLAALLTYRLMSSYGTHAILISVVAGILAGTAAYIGLTDRGKDQT